MTLYSDGTTNSTPTKTRADTRHDYLLQPSATVTLLPSIAEEKNGRGHFVPGFYGRSVSVDPSSAGGGGRGPAGGFSSVARELMGRPQEVRSDHFL